MFESIQLLPFFDKAAERIEKIGRLDLELRGNQLHRIVNIRTRGHDQRGEPEIAGLEMIWCQLVGMWAFG